MKKDIKHFVSAVLEKNYNHANKHLKVAINEKIKRKIINNNVSIF